MNSLLELFCDVDNFCKDFLPVWQNRLLTSGAMQRQRKRSLSVSEIMTILIYFHQSHYRHFKAYYTEHVLKHLRSEFPGLVSYTRFVEWIPSVLVPLCVYLRTACLGNVYRHLFHRFNRSGDLQEPKSPFPQGLCRAG